MKCLAVLILADIIYCNFYVPNFSMDSLHTFIEYISKFIAKPIL